MPDSPPSEPESVSVCDCAAWMRLACAGEPFYREHEGTRYCVLHFPGKEKSADFEKALQRKLENEDFDFRGVWFPDEVSFTRFSAAANFSKATFSGPANFRAVTFSAMADFHFATFSAEANFINATFSAGAYFINATFNAEAYFTNAAFSAEAYFSEATFNAAANFSEATFSANANINFATFGGDADFGAVTFGGEADFGAADFIRNVNFIYAAFRKEAYFRKATFGAEADFSRVTFDDYVRFAGEENRRPFLGRSSLDLQFTRIEKPDHVSFHMLTLRPHWFVNVDARKFDFVNVKWDSTLNKEIKALIEKKVETPHRLLAIACWHLAVNAEENHRYEEASKFRYMAMDARRQNNNPAPSKLHWLYWFVSGYGESISKAFWVLFGIWTLSAIAYMLTGHTNIVDLRVTKDGVRYLGDFGQNLIRALIYSLQVLTLQRPDRPSGLVTPGLVTLETILGTVQAALLALAIRRKFMR